MRFYGSFQKVDTEERMVFGYASTEDTDAAGETVMKSAVEDALSDYLEFANLREMHQLSAVGTTEEATVDDTGLYIAARVIDDTAWNKVKTGVYKGFSIGGKVLGRDPDNRKIITKVRLDEISLVDRPSNPKARFDVWKAVGAPSEDDADMANHAPKPTTTIAINVDTAEAHGKLDALKKAAQETASAIALAVGSQPRPDEVPAADPQSDAETVEKASAVDAVQAETGIEAAAADTADAPAADAPPAPVDPMNKAAAAIDALDAAVASVARADDMAKGLYSVGRFAEVLESISYLATSGQYESEAEGDNSPVPQKLRDWLKAGAAIFKEMAKEEIDELVALTTTKKAAAASDLAKAAPAPDAEAEPSEELSKALAEKDEALTKVAAERDDLAKRLADRDEAFIKMADRLEPLAKSVEDMAKRLEVIEEQPAPAKTGGAFAVDKADDAVGSLGKTVQPSPDDVAGALAAMPEEDRALLLIKAAHSLPRPIVTR